MTEELKIIMETIGQLGQAGKEAFIWWLVVKYVIHYLTVMFFIGTVGYVVIRVIKAVKAHQDEAKLATEVAVKAGLRPWAYYGREEWNKMYEWVRGK